MTCCALYRAAHRPAPREWLDQYARNRRTHQHGTTHTGSNFTGRLTPDTSPAYTQSDRPTLRTFQ